MNRKESVFRYLDILFNNTHRTGTLDKNVRWVDEDGETILSIKTTHIVYADDKTKNHKKLNIHFSNSEFYFIVNMFALEVGDTVDLIKEYISNTLIRGINLSLAPFHPYL